MIGAPAFKNRLNAAQKVQEAGYPLRSRLDPIVPCENWKGLYTDTIGRIFQQARQTVFEVLIQFSFSALYRFNGHRAGAAAVPI